MFDVVPQNTQMPSASFQSDETLVTQCPKGLCRGPCSDTLDGRCGTLRDQACVWIDNPAVDRIALVDVVHAKANGSVSVSRLHQLMQAGQFVHVCEIHSPGAGYLGDFVERGRQLMGWYDAMNVTGQLKARAVMPSSEAAGHLRAIGVDAIAVLSGRDCDATHLMTELAVMHCNEVSHVMCLSGDGGDASAEHVQMDSLSMLGLASSQCPERRLRLGAVVNPFSMPADLPIHQLKHKATAGADFVQTQMVFDIPRFTTFCQALVRERLADQVDVLAGVPVVVSEAGLALVKRLAGVWLPQSVEQRLRDAPDMRACGIAIARETIDAMRSMPGVAGVHVMLLGGDDVACLIDVVR